jgi:uncharacterized protein DUF6900
LRSGSLRSRLTLASPFSAKAKGAAELHPDNNEKGMTTMSNQHRSAETETWQAQLDALRQSLRLEQIARESLGIESLSQRGEADLEFHDLHVSQIREALNQAFDWGRRSATKQQPN